jgi:hypothetical protein
MSEPLTREQIIEQAARALEDARADADIDGYGDEGQGYDFTVYASAALPIITRAITDRVRTLHWQDGSTCGLCSGMRGVPYPCPTVCELDAIDAEMGVGR